MRTTLQLLGTPNEPLTALDAGGEGASLPSRVRFLKWGDNPSTKGNIRVGAYTAKALAENQRRFNFDLVALDYGHATVPGTQAYKESQEPRPVAAYGRPEVVEGEGLFLVDLAWTPNGRENAANFRDVSATVRIDPATGEVDFMHSGALCRQGAVPGMELMAASVELLDNQAAPLVSLDASTMAAVVDAVGAKLRDAEWYKREADETRAALDKANQTNAALQTALEAVTAQVQQLKAQLEASTSAAAPMDSLTALTADVSGLRSQLTASQDKSERDLLLLGARMQGKLIPLSADKLATVDLATLRDLVATAKPGQVPMGRLTPLSVPEVPLAGGGAADKRAADAQYRKAQDISARNPKWPWSRCWAEAQ